jgi:serine/threonine-protein phosphatase 5
MLHKEPNCVPIQPFRHDPDSSSSSAASVVVVGDVHGQLHDLLFLLRDAGYPSKDRIFVFNGDYVDRGAWGLETFLLLLAWKVKKKLFFSSFGKVEVFQFLFIRFFFYENF